MAEVRDAWDIRLGRAVAVKLLYPPFSAQPDNLRRFEVEARAAAALNHPHVVAVHDTGYHDGTPYIVMERLSGLTLGDVIARGPLPAQQVRAILEDVLSALAAAHAAGVLHRDIKPANILFGDCGVKVADFGVAKSAATPHTMTGEVVGTMAYLSADRIAGRPATVSDDLYAVGVVGYEALCGRRAFPQQNVAELVRAIAEDGPEPLAVVRPGVDLGLAAVVERAMSRDPQWRFDTANSMRAALAGPSVMGATVVGPFVTGPAVAGRPVAGSSVVGPSVVGRPGTRVMAEPLPPPSTVLVAPPVRPSRTKKLLALGAVLSAIALAAVLLIFDSRTQAPPLEPASTSTTVPTPLSIAPPPPPPTQVGDQQGEHPGPGNGHKKRGARGGD